MLTIIPHLQQLYSWDCGVASVAMVLNGMGIRISQSTIHQFYPLSSLWSIDLAYLLKHYGVRDFTFYTNHIGLNWEHSSIPFYKNAITNDVKRVHSLFSRAKEQGVNIINVGLSLDDIKRFLASNRYAIILLVNLNLMTCHLCMAEKKKENACCSSSCFPWFDSRKSRMEAYVHSSTNTYNRTHHEGAGHNTLLDFDVDVDILGAAARSSSSMTLPISIQPYSPHSMSIQPPISAPKPAVSPMPPLNTNIAASVQRRLSFGGILSHLSSPLPSTNLTTSMPNIHNPQSSISHNDQPSLSSSLQSSSTIPNLPNTAATAANAINSTPSSPLLSKTSYPPSSYSTTTTRKAPPLDKSKSNPICCFNPGYIPLPPEFIGHYVVVIGYDWKSDCFFYRDCGSESAVCAVKAELMMMAWKCKGTDQDAIVVKIL